MNRLKKAVCLAVCMGLLMGALAGCKREAKQEEDIFSIYATFYPIYAIAELLTQDVPNAQLSCLVQPQDGCLRDYSLSDWDLTLLVRSADVVIAGGRGLESFELLLYALGDDGPAVSSILHNMELETVEAVNSDPDSTSHWLDENPHVYMNIDGAIQIAERIAGSLEILDPENTEIYRKNLEIAKNRLKSAQDELHTIANNLENQKVIVMNEALTYLANEYNLVRDICFDRESGEALYDSELGNCISILAECDAKVVLIEKQAPESLKQALLDAGYALAEMDILSTVHASKGAEGYFEAQLGNARALRAAFDQISGN